MTSLPAPPSLAPSVYRSVIDELLEAWDELGEYRTRNRDRPIARTVFTLTAHTCSLARAAIHLWDSGYLTESMPIVRACFEAAVSAAWTQQTGLRGVEAYLYERARQNGNLIQQLDRVHVPVPADVRNAIAAAPLLSKNPVLKERPRKFEQLCRDLDGGDALYLMYRELSDESHASISLIRHLARGPDDTLVHVLRPDPGQVASSLAPCAVAYALTWAERAFCEMSKNRPNKQRLGAAARKLGIPRILIRK